MCSLSSSSPSWPGEHYAIFFSCFVHRRSCCERGCETSSIVSGRCSCCIATGNLCRHIWPWWEQRQQLIFARPSAVLLTLLCGHVLNRSSSFRRDVAVSLAPMYCTHKLIGSFCCCRYYAPNETNVVLCTFLFSGFDLVDLVVKLTNKV
eukprot:scpid68780/ scgid23909/ 